jgi:hypothetical protein
VADTKRVKPLSLENVLYFWSCSILGVPKRVRPKGLSSKTLGNNALGQNIAQCCRAVENTPGYQRDLALKGIDAGEMTDKEFWKWKEFEHDLNQSLTNQPLYPIIQDEADDRPPRPYMTLEQAAKRLKTTRNALSVRLHRMSTALPYGSCKTREGWKIYEEDLEHLNTNTSKGKTSQTSLKK